MQIIDRRLNPSAKSLENRQRFLRRAKAHIQRAVRDSIAEREIRDITEGGEVSIPVGDLTEPSFRRGPGGVRDYVLPGNRDFVEGDRLARPPGGAGPVGGGTDGESEDNFRFLLTREEFLDLFFDDLELPDLDKRRLAQTMSESMHRAGYAVTGSPANLALNRTMRLAMARRIALRRPTAEEIAALEAEIAAAPTEAKRRRFTEQLDLLERRQRCIPYIDPVDLRYRRFETRPKPVAQAVMFCLMDVSGSMTEHMKDLAKRFYMLLYIFLTRRYRHVEIVFIRHTHEAAEVDEETFFRSPASGGTVVSSALKEMQRIIADRYNPLDWNIYAAEASDGDNSSMDEPEVIRLMKEVILPACQYFAYVELAEEDGAGPLGFMPGASALWSTYRDLCAEGENIAMRKVSSRTQIYPVFRDLFQPQTAKKAGAS
jgi:uncharacterized sporulation protein YeaH/YhbH (DUF444 family)